MAIFDRLRGKREEQAADPSTAAAAAAVSPTLDLGEGSSGHHDPQVLGASRDSLKTFGVPAEEAGRLYDPYAGLGLALERREVKGGFRLPQQPEFLFSEEAMVHRRSWSENLTYYTGSGYLVGALLGGARGAGQAMTAPVAIAGVEGSQRLRLNQLLNTSGKLGRTAGNSLGVVGLLFASFESFIGYMSDGQLPDDANTLLAGASTGALYRSVRGPRQAAAAAAVGTIAASALLAARKLISPGL